MIFHCSVFFFICKEEKPEQSTVLFTSSANVAFFYTSTCLLQRNSMLCISRKRKVIQRSIVLLFSLNCTIFILVFRLHSYLNIESMRPNNSSSSQSRFEQDIYKQCPSISNTNSPKTISEDVHLLLRYSPRDDDKDGLHLQIAASYLLSQNLQELSSEQGIHTYMTIFLSEHYSEDTFIRLKRWFESIFTPYTSKTEIIPMKTNAPSI